MFSFHPNKKQIMQHDLYSNDWKTYEDNCNPNVIARAIKYHVTSPLIWNWGKRKGSNFKYADWVVLDVDSGLSLKDAMAHFKFHKHVIGTTKRHQIKDEKGNNTDRFRVWLNLSQRCDQLSNYTYNARKLANLYNTDSQAVDGARKFLPCKEIISVNVGESIVFDDYIPAVKKDIKSYSDKYIPVFIREMLTYGVVDGERNYACYTIAKYLHRNGHKPDEIFNLIMSSPVPKNSSCSDEVWGTVKRGCKL